MVNKTSTALIAAIFSVAAGTGMAWAQDDDAAAAPAETAAEAIAETATETQAQPIPETPAEATAEALSDAKDEAVTEDEDGAADDAPTAPQPGQSYVKETFGDWSMRCIKTPDNHDPCELYQLLHDSNGGPIAEASVVPVEGQVAALATFIAPLETDLPHGLRVQIDSNEAAAYPFLLCAPIGCIARVGLNDAELGSFKRGNAASLTLMPYGAEPNQAVKVDMSLAGFTAGIDAVSKVMKEIAEAEKAAAQ